MPTLRTVSTARAVSHSKVFRRGFGAVEVFLSVMFATAAVSAVNKYVVPRLPEIRRAVAAMATTRPTTVPASTSAPASGSR